MAETESDLKQTVLADRHAAAGARFVPFAGYRMPIQYDPKRGGGIVEEHRWTRTQASLFDVSHMGIVDIVGADAGWPAGAWAACASYSKDHVNAAKALPALIMNSGLMQVLAFCHEKGKAQAPVAEHLRTWLAGRFPATFKQGSGFEPFMQALMGAAPADYQAINAEAFAWLKWLRQMAAARNK